MENMKEMHQLTSSALQFVQDLTDYAKGNGYILLHDEPIIHLHTEESLSMTITQSIYVAEIDIEITAVGYLENSLKQEMVVETTFDFLLGDSITINQIHDLLKGIRDERTNNFFVCIRGSQEEGFCEDEISVVIRKKHAISGDDTFKQWDSLIQLIRQGQEDSPPFLSLDSSVGPNS